MRRYSVISLMTVFGTFFFPSLLQWGDFVKSVLGLLSSFWIPSAGILA